MTNQPAAIDLEKLIGRKTIIYGEVGRGKTRLLEQLIERLVQAGFSEEITVIDMAPQRIGRAGGPLMISRLRLRYLRPDIVYAPRIQSSNAEQVLQYVKHNVARITMLLKAYLENPTRILAINDLTIFLQGGELDDLLTVINHAQTFIGTAYYGTELDEDYGSGVSERERRLINILLGFMDNLIRLD